MPNNSLNAKDRKLSSALDSQQRGADFLNFIFSVQNNTMSCQRRIGRLVVCLSVLCNVFLLTISRALTSVCMQKDHITHVEDHVDPAFHWNIDRQLIFDAQSTMTDRSGREWIIETSELRSSEFAPTDTANVYKLWVKPVQRSVSLTQYARGQTFRCCYQNKYLFRLAAGWGHFTVSLIVEEIEAGVGGGGGENAT